MDNKLQIEISTWSLFYRYMHVEYKLRYIIQCARRVAAVTFITGNDWKVKHSQTCAKRSTLGQRKSGLIRQVTS